MLDFTLTDRLGTQLAHIDKHYGGSVAIPVGDARSARVSIDLWNPACEFVVCLKTMLKVTYDDDLVYWGPIHQPSWNGEEENRLVLNSMDPMFYIKHRHMGYGDDPVANNDARKTETDDPPTSPGYTIDGPGMWSIIAAANPSADQITAGALTHGIILCAEDTSNLKETKFWAQRGANCWDEFDKVQQLAGAPDWNLRPIDATHPGVTETWDPGVYAELAFYAYRGVQRFNLRFQDGWGRDNCRIGYEPDGSAAVNSAVVVGQGGQVTDTETDTRVISDDMTKWEEVGIMQTWTTSGTDAKKAMQSQADATVHAYRDPPGYFTVTLQEQGPDTEPYTAAVPYRYLQHFTEGDEIRGEVHRGFFHQKVEGRIKQVTLSDDEKGRTTTALDCVPNVGVDDFAD